MPKRKRTNQEKVDHYQRKLRKYIGISSPSSDEESQSEDFIEVPEIEMVPDNLISWQDPNPLINESVPEDPPVDPAPPGDNTLTPERSDPVPDNIEMPDLAPELLSALGEVTDDTPKFGEKIHNNLASLWPPLLRKGLTRDSKDKILKEYLVPENCTLLQAPKLNPEISAAITEMARNRDKKMETAQQQLGTGVTAVNRAITILLTSGDIVKAIKILSDSCRIFSDLHFCKTQVRTKLLTPCLAKPFLNIIQDTERDELLFGSKLQDKIKASKAIEKQGFQIRKSVPVAKNMLVTPSTSTPTISRGNYQFQGNWSGPPRYPSNRGGRGGQRRGAVNRKPAPNPSSRPAGQGKSRATPQQ